MLLSNPIEMDMVKAMLYTNALNTGCVVKVIVERPGGKCLTIEVTESYINIRADFPDTVPVVEHYRSPQALAVAYGVPLSKVRYETD